MKLRLTEPSDERVRRLIASQAGERFTYAAVGATERDAPPARRRSVDLPIDRFDAARRALAGWTQYDLGWTRVPVKPPIEPGRDFATVARTLGVWSANCCRVVYAVDEADRFGYGIGTLPHHVETGEERFLLTRDGSAGRCTFEISSFSRANDPLVRLGWWYGERAVRRFLREGTARLKAEAEGTP